MGDPFRFTQRKMKQFTAIGVLMVSALAASAPYDPAYAPQYYYQPRPVQPYYYTPEAYAGQYVYERPQYSPLPVVYRYVRSAQQEPAFNLPQSAALENRRAGPPPPPPIGNAPPVFDIPFRKGADAIASGSSIQSRATPQGPDYVDYGAYTGNHGSSAGTRITLLEVTTTTRLTRFIY